MVMMTMMMMMMTVIGSSSDNHVLQPNGSRVERGDKSDKSKAQGALFLWHPSNTFLYLLTGSSKAQGALFRRHPSNTFL